MSIESEHTENPLELTRVILASSKSRSARRRYQMRMWPNPPRRARHKGEQSGVTLPGGESIKDRDRRVREEQEAERRRQEESDWGFRW